MAAIATDVVTLRRWRPRPWFLVASVAAAAALLYALMRVDSGRAVQASYGFLCSRLNMRPNDWPCRVQDAHTVAVYVVGSLTIALGLAVPGMVLAATGRRFTALLPLAMPVTAAGLWGMTTAVWYMEPHAFGSPYLGMWPATGWRIPETYWAAHPSLASAADLAILAAPAIAIAAAMRPEKMRREAAPSWRATLAALACCGAASAGFLWGLIILAHRLWPDAFGWVSVEPGAVIVPAMTMGTFGWLLGTDRRWFPWIHVPVAILLSGAIMTALLASVGRIDDLSGFGAAIPYAGIGVICSFVRPLARRLARQPAEVQEQPTAAAPRSRRALRPAVALNAAAVAVLVVAGGAFIFNPAPTQYGASLPTYLGERTYVDDLRTKLNLRDALSAVDAYRTAHGTFVGFDAAAGLAGAPALVWRDGLPTTQSASDGQPLQIAVVTASDSSAELASLSVSGRAFCVRDSSADGTRYGTAGGYDARFGSQPMPVSALAAAVAACASRPWSEASFRPFPIGSLCIGAGDSALPICRAVQGLMRRTMASAIPAP